jgi:hypothetical protein
VPLPDIQEARQLALLAVATNDAAQLDGVPSLVPMIGDIGGDDLSIEAEQHRVRRIDSHLHNIRTLVFAVFDVHLVRATAIVVAADDMERGEASRPIPAS